jgi:hypothetical protein
LIHALGLVAQIAVALALGYLASLLLWRALPVLRDGRGSLEAGTPERLLLAISGFVLFAVALMIVNIVTGGLVFGSPWPVPVAALVLIAATFPDVAADLRRIRASVDRDLVRRAAPWIVALLVLSWLYVWPALAGASGARTGDVPSHLGWTEQLLGGQPVPAGAAPEVPDNAYPWGLHAVMATLVRAVPGTDALLAVDAVHILIVGGILLAAACLARRFHARAGWAAAGCVSLIGGFGWLSAGEPDFVLSPSNARYGADLVVASPNSLYELFPPSLPRELGLVLLGTTGVLLLMALRAAHTKGGARLWIAAGVIAGVTGVVSMPLFLCAVLWCAAVALVSPRATRLGALALSLPPALAVFALWVGPVIAGYVQEGGFVDITARLGIEWDFWSAVWSWGLLVPLILLGIVICYGGLKRIGVIEADGATGRALVILFATTALLLGLAYARSAFDWAIANNATILHMGRFWPPLHLLGAVLAGIGLAGLYRVLDTRARFLGAAACGALLVVGAISPVFASIRLAEIIDAGEDGYSYGKGPLAEGSFVRNVADRLGPDDVLKVEGPPELAYAIFQFSGVRLAEYDDKRFDHNDLRIRYENLAEKWDEVVAAGGYTPGFVVRPAGTFATEGAIVAGDYGGETWILIPETATTRTSQP